MIPVTSNVNSSIILYCIFKLFVRGSGVFFQHIAHSHLGIYELGRKVFFNFFPEEIYVNIDYVRLGIKIYVPDIEGYIDPRHHFILIPDKIFQELKFFCRRGGYSCLPG